MQAESSTSAHMFELVLVLLICCLALCTAVDPLSIRHVKVVFMNHLDVGFDGIDPVLGFAKNVLNRYFDVYFPRALRTSAEMRSQGSSYIYTTHAYLISMYLDCPIGLGLHCPTDQQRHDLIRGIERGDIVWHAFPFNAQTEWSEPSLLEFGFEFAQTLSTRFNISTAWSPPRVMSQRDVPGMTRAMLPLLRKHGVVGLSFGVNSASATAAVPKIFRWLDEPSGSEMLTMYHPGDYGGIEIDDCVMVDGFDTALAMAFRGDNAGPHEPSEVLQIFTQLSSQFPNADVTASTWDQFVAAVLPHRASLPVITSEMGDTWIHGVSSDPYKTALLRAAFDARAQCLGAGQCDTQEYRFYNFSRLLIKGIEHTWAGDVKKFLNDTEYLQWSNADFNAIRNSAGYQNLEATWFEQRLWALEAPLQALGDHPLAAEISRRWHAIRSQTIPQPDQLGYTQVQTDIGQVFRIGDFSIAFDAESGAITTLTELSNGTQWADAQHPLAQFLYQTFDQNDVNSFLDQYIYCQPMDIDACSWVLKDFGKLNVSTARPISQIVPTTLQQLWFKPVSTQDTATASSFLLLLSLPTDAHTQAGAPATIWLQVVAQAPALKISVQWSDKTPTRLPESLWLRFGAAADNVLVQKAGGMIDLHQRLFNASSHLHGIWNSVVLQQGSQQLSVSSPSSAVVSVGLPVNKLTAYPIPVDSFQPDFDAGVAFNLFNNLWGTNYIMYWPFAPENAITAFDFVLQSM